MITTHTDKAGLYSSLFSSAPDALAILDRNMALVEANERFASLIGYTLEEIEGFHAWDWDVSLNREELEAIGTAGSFGKRPPMESVFRRKDGVLVPVEVHAALIVHQGRELAFCAVRDITARKRLEQDLRKEAGLNKAMFANSPDALVIVDTNAALVDANPAFLRMTGSGLEEARKLHVWDWDARFTREDVKRILGSFQAEQTVPMETLIRHKDGGTTPVELHATFMPYEGQNLIFSVLRDFSGRKQTELLLRERELLHAAMIEQAPVGVVLLDLETLRCVEFNDVACGMLGYAREEFGRLKLTDINTPWSDSEHVQKRDELQKFGQHSFETVHRTKDGSLVDVHVSARLVEIKGRAHSLAFWTDISERKRAEKETLSREQEVRTLVENSPDGILRYDRQLRRVFANPAAAGIFGMTPEQLNAVTIDTGPIMDKDGYKAALTQVFTTGQQLEKEFEGRMPDNRTGWGLIRFAPEFDGEGRVASVLTIVRDITEMVRQRRELHRMAFYDVLTGLPNRALLRDRVRQEAAEVKRRGGLFALMILDLDNFKDINDTLGHAAGDRLLRETTKRLTGCIREYDTLSRLGGDEFALLMPGIRLSQDMGAVARSILDAMASPFRVGERDVFTSASIGIAVYPDDTRSIGELFARADAAMYHAKSKGRNTFQFYDAKLTEAAERKLSLGAALRQALARGELELFYQPKVDMPTGRVLGAEALLRWHHPEMGLLTPDKFIGLAEDTGLIVDIGRWVLEEACTAVSGWNRSRTQPLRVAVNLSSRQFLKGDLVATVKEVLDKCGCHGSWLEMEITETIMLEDNPAIQAMLESLRDIGATIAIDDFGTGHSALSYLNRFKVEVLKIDRSFVMGVETDRRKAELVKAFIAVAKALGMGLVAEGVELPVQADFLCANDCTVGQGYLYSRPVPLEAFEALMGSSFSVCSPDKPG